MNTGMITRKGGLLAACGAVVLLVGCGGSDEPSAAPTSSSPATSASASPTASGTMVTVTESEYALQLSQDTFSAGTYTFVAKNAGHTTHALEIEGPGVEEQQTNTLGPGESGQLTVDLQAGTYELTCPVDGHKDLGMQTEITVAG